MKIRRVFGVNVNADNLKILDQYVIAPCSRSDVIDEIIAYVIKSPEFLKSLVDNKLEQIKNSI